MGRWQGVHVRLHMFFLVFAAFTLYLSWIDSRTPQLNGAPAWAAIGCLVVLLLSVLAHEWGHVVVAKRLGAPLAEIVVAPIGGLGPMPNGLEPQADLVLSMAGPLANLGMSLMAAFCLMLQGHVSLASLMNPIAPDGIMAGNPLAVMLKLIFWVNWMLALLNLIPAYPFDGGRMLRSGLLLTQIVPDTHQASWVVTRVANFVALLLVLAAWLIRDHHPPHLVAAWFPLLILAIFIFFSSRREEQPRQSTVDDVVVGYDFSEGYTSLERSNQQGLTTTTKSTSSPIVRWWNERREERLQRQRELEILEDGLLDDILSRVHQSGIESISKEDRLLLQRVSARYRSRNTAS